MRRFDVELDPATEIMPAIGAKECIFNLNLAFADPGDAVLSADPGYPVYTGGPLIAGADPVLMALLPEHGFTPDLMAISDADRARAKLMFFNYPNNPTGAVVREGFFEQVVDYVGATTSWRSTTTRTPRRRTTATARRRSSRRPAPRRSGSRFSLSKGYNMTGWRCAAIVGNAEAIEHYWRLKTNIDSGLFEAVQLAGVAALSPDADGDKAEMNALYLRRRDLVVDALRGSASTSPRRRARSTSWAPIPAGFETAAAYCEHVLDEAGVVISPGGADGQRRGLLSDSLTMLDDRLVQAVQRLGQLAG